MYRISRTALLFTYFLLFINNTKQSHVRQAVTLKAISKTVKSPLFKQIGNTIKNSVSIFQKKKNTIKNLAFGLQEKFIRTKHNLGNSTIKNLNEGDNFVSKTVKYLQKEAIQKFKYMKPSTVKKNIMIKSDAQMKGQELGYLINTVSKSKTQLSLLFVTGGVNLTQLNVLRAKETYANDFSHNNVFFRKDTRARLNSERLNGKVKSFKIFSSQNMMKVIPGIVLFIGAKFQISKGKNIHNPDLKGKVILVSGGTAGIGKENVKKFTELGATVIFTGRSQTKASDLLKELDRSYPDSPKAKFLQCDLSDLQSIKHVADYVNQNYSQLDVIQNNAGANIEKRHKTKDEFDANFQVNHLGGFYLTSLLYDLLKNTSQSRVINVSSMGHDGPWKLRKVKLDFDDIDGSRVPDHKYDGLKAYSYAKLMNVMFAKGFEQLREKEYLGDSLKGASLSPGWVRDSDIWVTLSPVKKFIYYLMYPILYLTTKNCLEGSQTNLHCSLCPFEELKDGGYYSDCKEHSNNPEADKPEDVRKQWNMSIDMLENYTNEKIPFPKL